MLKRRKKICATSSPLKSKWITNIAIFNLKFWHRKVNIWNACENSAGLGNIANCEEKKLEHVPKCVSVLIRRNHWYDNVQWTPQTKRKKRNKRQNNNTGKKKNKKTQQQNPNCTGPSLAAQETDCSGTLACSGKCLSKIVNDLAACKTGP